ncbi:hypothetical protein Hanom_Chr11g00991421 [Helianthus anomalus]
MVVVGRDDGSGGSGGFSFSSGFGQGARLGSTRFTSVKVSSTRFGPESTRSDSGSYKSGQTAHGSDLISDSGYEKVRSNPSQLGSTAGQTSVSGVTDLVSGSGQL